MPEGFQTIPDWFSFENQGAGVAITDFGDGQQHLVVLMVDNPPQQNRGLYRIGHKLGGEGRVIGDWTLWIDVPDWFSWENQGADIAVAGHAEAKPNSSNVDHTGASRWVTHLPVF